MTCRASKVYSGQNFNITFNWGEEEQSSLKTGLPFRWTWTGWKNGPYRICTNSNRTNTKHLHLRGPGNNTGWWVAGEQCCGKALGIKQADCEPAVGLVRKGHQHPRLYKEEPCQQMRELITTSTRCLLVQTWSNAPRFGPPQYKRYTQNVDTAATEMLKEPEHPSCE